MVNLRVLRARSHALLMESTLFVTTAPGFIWNVLQELRVMLLTQVTQCTRNVISPIWKVTTSKIAKDYSKGVLMSHLFTYSICSLLYFSISTSLLFPQVASRDGRNRASGSSLL